LRAIWRVSARLENSIDQDAARSRQLPYATIAGFEALLPWNVKTVFAPLIIATDRFAPRRDRAIWKRRVMDERAQQEFMHLALLEGRKALPGCIPNPPVGYVLVRQGRVVATVYTSPPGEKHAEAMALSQLSGALTDVTAFVTLEPCSFHGRTPSCFVRTGTRLARLLDRLSSSRRLLQSFWWA
jgi:hypothetical protein